MGERRYRPEEMTTKAGWANGQSRVPKLGELVADGWEARADQTVQAYSQIKESR